MRIWTSSVLLATLVVIGLSFPLPDDHEYKIPSVGAGPRSQYYVLHKDGTYKYGFDTGDGAFESVKSHTLGSLDGKFGYVDPDGNTIKLEYEAGRGGFVARGDHLPKPSPELAQAIAAVVKRSEPFVDPLAGGDGDASYGFKFQSEDHSRTEEADSDGTVTGSYSYTDENGVLRKFTYKAGKGIGFVIEGDGLTIPIDNTPAISNPIRPSAHFSRTQSPIKHSAANFRQPAYYTGNKASIISTRSQVPGDASYSFSYDADDHSRSEVSDDKLNIEGSFSFLADDGEKRTLNYEAGSRTGFVAHGAHLPVAPVVSFGNRVLQERKTSVKPAEREYNKGLGNIASQGQRRGASQHTSTKQISSLTNQPAQTKLSGTQANQISSTRQTESQIGRRHQTANVGFSSAIGNKNQVSASYKSGQQTATRNAVSQINQQQQIAGAFSNSQKVGQQAITKQSGTSGSQSSLASQGQRNSGSSAYKTSQQLNTKQSGSQYRPQQIAGPTHNQRQQSHESSGVNNGFTRSSASVVSSKVPSLISTLPKRPFEEANIRSSSSSDGSYSFSYNTDSHSRSETGDSKNNVVGKFDFLSDDDDERREIVYEAGRETGFIAEGKHIPIGPSVPGAPSGQPTGRIVPVKQVPFFDPLADSDSDASYKFEFDSDTYSRSESADEDGNVVGKYTVVDEDGLRVTYKFKAGKGIGFETEEISRIQGPKPAVPTPYSGPLASDTPATFTKTDQSSFTHSFNTGGSRSTHDSTFGIKREGSPQVHKLPASQIKTNSVKSSNQAINSRGTITGSTTHSFSNNAASTARGSSSRGDSQTFQKTPSYTQAGVRRTVDSDKGASSKFPVSSSTHSQTGSKHSFQSSKVNLKSNLTPAHTQQVFPGFKLFSYAPSPSAEKFGYVLKFDN